MRFLGCGDVGLLVEVDDLPAVLELDRAVRAAGWPTVIDVVPAARTVLLHVAAGTDLAVLERAVRALELARVELARVDLVRVDGSPAEVDPVVDGLEVEVDVVYDGPDLAEVAELTGLSVDEVVAAHTGRPWRVAFGGFAPGFAYLVGGDPRLEVPRRPGPRTSVPAGSVGLAGAFSGVYPRASPGGWQLLGRTDAVLWDVDRTPPALLGPGVSVRFRAVPG